MKYNILIILFSLGMRTFALSNNFQEVEDAKQGITFYKPNYAMLGSDPILEMKLQFSFKFRFVEEDRFEKHRKSAITSMLAETDVHNF